MIFFFSGIEFEFTENGVGGMELWVQREGMGGVAKGGGFQVERAEEGAGREGKKVRPRSRQQVQPSIPLRFSD